MTFIGSRKVGIDVLTLVGSHERPKELDPDRFKGMDQDLVENILEHEQEERRDYGYYFEDLVGSWDNDKNHVLDALVAEKKKRDDAAERIRLLVAYAREVISGSRPTLASLAEVMGMTISGVRGLYDQDDVAAVRELLGGIDQRVYQQLLPLSVRAHKIADYIESLFLMTGESLDVTSKRIVEAMATVVMLPNIVGDYTESYRSDTWPLNMMVDFLDGYELRFSANGFLIDIESLPESILEREAVSVDLVRRVFGPYYDDSKKADARRASDFAPVANRINTLMESDSLSAITAKIRELANEVVPEQGE